jgi:uncharacterized protein (TIGR02996 family)
MCQIARPSVEAVLRIILFFIRNSEELAMANEEAFLQAIIEEPDDKSLRLIYADWLEESDSTEGRSAGARAEFIRVQFALNDVDVTNPRYQELLDRQQELQQRHRSLWLEPLKPHLHPRIIFRHGLPEQVDLSAVDFLLHAEALFRLGPIRHVRLTKVREYLSDLARCPYLGRIEFLDLSDNQLRPSDMEILAQLLRPQGAIISLLPGGSRSGSERAGLDRLAGLSLSGNPVGAEGLRSLTRVLEPGRLRYLNLNATGLGAAGSEVLSTWPGFSQLAQLHMDQNLLSAACVDLLVRRSQAEPPRLRVLSLAGNQIPPLGLRLLAQAPRLAALTYLCLAHNPLGNEGLETLARCPVLSDLQVLDLNSTRISATGARALAASPTIRNLTRLDLAHNQIGHAGAVALSRSANLSRLETLDLSGNEISDEGAKALAASPHLTQLTSLNLSANGIKAFGLKALLVALGRLHTLDLSGNQLGNLAVEVLALAPGLKQLVRLNLRNNHIDDDGARALAASPYLSGLRHLDLSDNDLTEEGAELLRKSPLGNNPQACLLPSHTSV